MRHTKWRWDRTSALIAMPIQQYDLCRGRVAKLPTAPSMWSWARVVWFLLLVPVTVGRILTSFALSFSGLGWRRSRRLLRLWHVAWRMLWRWWGCWPNVWCRTRLRSCFHQCWGLRFCRCFCLFPYVSWHLCVGDGVNVSFCHMDSPFWPLLITSFESIVFLDRTKESEI